MDCLRHRGGVTKKPRILGEKSDASPSPYSEFLVVVEDLNEK